MAKASREFQVFAKPAGATCNFTCSYCYYLKKEQLYLGKGPLRMPDDLLERYVIQHIEASPDSTITFSWHGGEPTILGLDYFRKIVALEKKHRPSGKIIANGIQTNGYLLDEEWCRFFFKERFRVGLSLDGPAAMHDCYRITKGKEATHARAMRAFELLRRYQVPCDLLCVVHDRNVRSPLEVYRFLREIGSRFIGFLPVVELCKDAACGVSPQSITAEDYGTFLCTIFDEWRRNDIGRVMVQIFEEASRAVHGLEHSLCIFRKTCGDIPVVEHNGDFYSCDHFVNQDHYVGNLHDNSMSELLESPAQKAFGDAKVAALPRYCLECQVLAMCNGGCPKDRIAQTPDGEPGLNYLCEGLKRFFVFSRPHLANLAPQEPDGQPPEHLRQVVQEVNTRTFANVGRNDPCPCGSGKKYKKCCLK
jgi:uncharacterized protein